MTYLYYSLDKDRRPINVSKEKAVHDLFAYKRTKSVKTKKGYHVLMGFRHYEKIESPLPHKLFFITVSTPDFPELRLLKFLTYEEANTEFERLCEEFQTSEKLSA